MTEQLKGEALDEALREAGLPTSGSADEKRARLAEHEETTAGTRGGEQPEQPEQPEEPKQPDQSNENPKAFEADPHVVPGVDSALKGPSQDELNPAYAPPPQPDQNGDQGSSQ